jgi:hypothetical protein
MLIREAALAAEYQGLNRVEVAVAEIAKNKITVALVERLQRPSFLEAINSVKLF